MVKSNNELYERLKETKTGRTKIFDGVVLRVVRDDIVLPNGAPATREVVLHNGAVCVVALTENNEIIMERQFRYPFNDVLWEIPAGKLNDGETDPLAAIKRELKEETGYTAESYRFLGAYYPSPAILSEKTCMYLATGLSEGESKLDEDEFLEVVKLPLDTVVKMVLDGEIPDGKTQAAVLKAKAMIDAGMV